MAKCYLKGGTEHTIIVDPREAYIQPFDALNWVDLRVGFFTSITATANDDLITGLAETISNSSAGLAPSGRYWIGLKTNEPDLPRTSGVVFMGYSNAAPAQQDTSTGGDTTGDSVLSGSDTGIIAGVNYWWPHNGLNSDYSAIITDGQSARTWGGGAQQHFAQVVGGAGAAGYATLHVIRLTRPDPNSRFVTMNMKVTPSGHSSDVLFSSTPTKDIIQTNLATFPTSLNAVGPVDLTRVPNALYFYWPWVNSRLRIHAIGVLKAS